MAKRTVYKQKKMFYMPNTLRVLETVGEQIHLARLRRKLTVTLVSERAGVSRQTVWKVERGDPSVAFGIYAKILNTIGMQNDLLLIAKDDVLGRLLQDAELERKSGYHASKNL